MLDKNKFTPKRISIVTPCYNEQDNVQEIYRQIKDVLGQFPSYTYEHIFIDNASTDLTVPKLIALAERDPNVKIIMNARNFGQIRSPYYAMYQASGDAVIVIACDLQDPPQLIADFIRHWESGYKIVIGVKVESEESKLMFLLRKLYYTAMKRISDVPLIKNFTGFALYDRQVLDIIRQIQDPIPYMRGLVCEIGFEKKVVPYKQPSRKFGITKNNFLSLYDYAVLGLVNHSKAPIRIATFLGVLLSTLGIVGAIGSISAKLILGGQWHLLNTLPLVLMSFLAGVQLVFLGLIGEYLLSTHYRILNRPMVVEKGRVNFEEPTDPELTQLQFEASLKKKKSLI